MKVFISWSGERSRRVAELLREWIECVIQAVEPWVSSSDIDRGSLWFTQIIEELSTTTHGIICLTRENKEKPWILFEAGALAKGLSSARIYTLLVDLESQEIRDPLAQFNHTHPNEGEMFKLVSSINRGLESRGLKEGVLVNAFRTYWPQFQESFDAIITETEATTAPKVERKQDDILSEILNSVRGLDKRVRQVEEPVLTDKQPEVDKQVRLSALKQEIAKRDAMVSLAKEALQRGQTEDEIISLLKTLLPSMPAVRFTETLVKAREQL